MEELEVLEDLVNSEGWKLCISRWSDHRDNLNKRMLIALKNHEDRVAGEYRAQYEETGIMVDIIKNRIKELKEKERKNNVKE